MTIREVIDIIQSIYSKGVPSDDSRLTNRQIYNKLIRLRATLLSQKSNKNQAIGQWNYQTIPCIELQIAPLIECPYIPPTGLFILKSVQPFPNVVSDLRGHMIQSLTSVEGNTSYGETKWETKKYQKANKYTSKKPDFYIRNRHLYLTSNKYPEVVTSTAIFGDPLDVYNFKSGCYQSPEDCLSYLDREFPLDEGIIDAIATMSQDELIKTFEQSKADTMNNSMDDSQTVK